MLYCYVVNVYRGGLTSVLVNNARLQPPNLPENNKIQQPQQPKTTQPPSNIMGKCSSCVHVVMYDNHYWV